MTDLDLSKDIWAESDDDEQVTYERNLAEIEWERLQEDHGNVKLDMLEIVFFKYSVLFILYI